MFKVSGRGGKWDNNFWFYDSDYCKVIAVGQGTHYSDYFYIYSSNILSPFILSQFATFISCAFYTVEHNYLWCCCPYFKF
jgi:hypothetical protein